MEQNKQQQDRTRAECAAFWRSAAGVRENKIIANRVRTTPRVGQATIVEQWDGRQFVERRLVWDGARFVPEVRS